MDPGLLCQNKLQLKTGSRSEENHNICTILLTPVSTFTTPQRLGQNSYNSPGWEGELINKDNPDENCMQPLNPPFNPVSKDQQE